MYLHFRDEEIAHSISSDAKIIVDLDELGKMVGIEVLLNGAESIAKFSKLLTPDGDQPQMALSEHLGNDDNSP